MSGCVPGGYAYGFWSQRAGVSHIQALSLTRSMILGMLLKFLNLIFTFIKWK